MTWELIKTALESHSLATCACDILGETMRKVWNSFTRAKYRAADVATHARTHKTNIDYDIIKTINENSNNTS